MVKFLLLNAVPLEELELKDCTFRFGKKEIKVNRTILSLRSSYFRDLFLTNEQRLVFSFNGSKFLEKTIEKIVEIMYTREVEVEEDMVEAFKQTVNHLKMEVREEEEGDDDETLGNYATDLDETSYLEHGLEVDDIIRSLPKFKEIRKAFKGRKLHPRKARPSLGFDYSGGTVPCSFCPYLLFPSRSAAASHELNCSYNIASQPFFSCEFCGKKYQSEAKMKKHRDNHRRQSVAGRSSIGPNRNRR